MIAGSTPAITEPHADEDVAGFTTFRVNADTDSSTLVNKRQRGPIFFLPTIPPSYEHWA
jgi:hypothetical protein